MIASGRLDVEWAGRAGDLRQVLAKTGGCRLVVWVSLATNRLSFWLNAYCGRVGEVRV